MIPHNIIKCNKCEAPLIYEELQIHECCSKKIVDAIYDTDRNEYYLFDGKKWYRWFPPNFKHPNGTPKEETEPNFMLKILVPFS